MFPLLSLACDHKSQMLWTDSCSVGAIREQQYLEKAGTKLNFTYAAKMVGKGLSPPCLPPSSRFPRLQRLFSLCLPFRFEGRRVNCHSYETGTSQWSGGSTSNYSPAAPCGKELEGKFSSIFSCIPQPPEEGIFSACFLQLPSLEGFM